jgi:predicted CopG family antitoxin
MARLSLKDSQYIALNEIRKEMGKKDFSDTIEWLIDCHNLNRALVEALQNRANNKSDYEKISSEE